MTTKYHQNINKGSFIIWECFLQVKTVKLVKEKVKCMVAKIRRGCEMFLSFRYPLFLSLSHIHTQPLKSPDNQPHWETLRIGVTRWQWLLALISSGLLHNTKQRHYRMFFSSSPMIPAQKSQTYSAKGQRIKYFKLWKPYSHN